MKSPLKNKRSRPSALNSKLICTNVLFSTPNIYALSGKYFRTTLRRFRQVNYIIYTGISGQNRNVINEKNVLRKADPHCSMVQKLKTGEGGSYLTILAEKRVCLLFKSKQCIYYTII